jgi:basic membrane protein A
VLGAIYKDNTWANYAGKTTSFNASNNGVGLPTTVIGDKAAKSFDRFKSFAQKDYDAIFKKLAGGSVTLLRKITVADANGIATADELVSGLGLKKVAVTVR